MSAIFYQIFIFSPNEKRKFIDLKSSFRSKDIQVFVVFPFPHFPDSKGQMEVE